LSVKEGPETKTVKIRYVEDGNYWVVLSQLLLLRE